MHASSMQRTGTASLSVQTIQMAANRSACSCAGACTHETRMQGARTQAPTIQPKQVPMPARHGHTAPRKHSAAAQASTNNSRATKHTCRCSTSQQHHHCGTKLWTPAQQQAAAETPTAPRSLQLELASLQATQCHKQGCCQHAVTHKKKTKAAQSYSRPAAPRTTQQHARIQHATHS
jgi:hypothetical protein